MINDLANQLVHMSGDHPIPYFMLLRWAPGTWLHTYEFIEYAIFMGGLI